MPKTPKKARFVVELELPSPATKSDAKDYIETCVRSWHGSLFPGDDRDPPDPMWDLNADTVRVLFYRRGREKDEGNP